MADETPTPDIVKPVGDPIPPYLAPPPSGPSEGQTAEAGEASQAEAASESAMTADPENIYLIRAANAGSFQRDGVRFEHGRWTIVENPTDRQKQEPRLICVPYLSPNFDRLIGPLPIIDADKLPGRPQTPTIDGLLQRLNEKDGEISLLQQIAEGEAAARREAETKLAAAWERNQALDAAGHDKDAQIAALEADNARLSESLKQANEEKATLAAALEEAQKMIPPLVKTEEAAAATASEKAAAAADAPATEPATDSGIVTLDSAPNKPAAKTAK